MSVRRRTTKRNSNPVQEVLKLKDELDKANNFIDYFLIVGLNPIISMEKWLYEENITDLNTNHPDHIKPEIISYFPKFAKRTIFFDDSLISHCFPKGFKIIESDTTPPNEIFSFVLDNNYYSLLFPQKFLSCLVFYEPISNYQILYNKKLELETSTTPTPGQQIITKQRNYYIPKCIMFISLHPFFSEFELILKEIHNYILNNNTNITIPLDKIIENFLIEIPVPPKGIFKIEYNLFNQIRIIDQNLMNQLPLIAIDLKLLFMFFTVEEIVSIYRYIMLESRVLFFSKEVDLLNPFVWGMLSMLYPFRYQYQVITILPPENFETLESITPFIAGINQTYVDTFFKEGELTLSDDIVIVDIDNKRVVIEHGEATMNVNDDESDDNEKLPDFPSRPKKEIEKKLNIILSPYKRKEEANNRRKSLLNKLSSAIINEKKYAYINENISKEFNTAVNDAFFNFNSSLLKNYANYLNTDFYISKGQPDFSSLFKLDEFLNIQNSSDRLFYIKFLSETQIFGDFLYKRMIPKDSNEKLQILAFDEKINEISSIVTFFKTQPQSVFTTSQEYNIISNFRVQKPRTLCDVEINFYTDKINHRKLLNHGIIIQQTENNNNNSNSQVSFYYPIFPSLTTQFFFVDNIQEYYTPIPYNEELDPINADIISKSHLGSITESDMGNYITMCWIQLWAISLWYCDAKEKPARFDQLMSILDKVTNHDMEIFNLLFDALTKYGEDYMILELYGLIVKLKLNPSLLVRDTIMKIIDSSNYAKLSEKNLEETIETIKRKKGIIRKETTNIDKSKYRKRTLKNKYNANILNEEVLFYAFDSCVNCSEDINLEELSTKYDEMKKDILWAECPKCKNNLLPKITIKLGNEMNKKGELIQNTSGVECVVLFSPQFLKINFNNNLIKEYGIKLDVEEFKMKYSALFWNSIWYFKLKKYDYEFFLPYETSLNHNVISKINNHINISTEQVVNKEKKLSSKNVTKMNVNNCFKIEKCCEGEINGKSL